jgi:hypothetical protein
MYANAIHPGVVHAVPAPLTRRPPFGSPDPPRCRHCGDVIGVYEPYVRVAEDEIAVSSRVADAGAPTEGHLYHFDCYAELEP